MKKVIAGLALIVLSPLASADVFQVDAENHSYAGGFGTGLDTGMFFDTGDLLSASVSILDLWSAGALPRWSNADGLGVTAITDASGNLFATGDDESGEDEGTLIGQDFGLYTTADGSFNFGTLVGRIGTGSYFKIGTSLLNYAATSSGNLRLFYWDSNFADNVDSVLAIAVTPVPEPQTYAVLLAGLGLLGFLMRRRKDFLGAAA